MKLDYDRRLSHLTTKQSTLFPWCPFAGVAVDGPNKTATDINGKTICLIKKTGKVKALDEALYSEFTHIWFIFLIKPNL